MNQPVESPLATLLSAVGAVAPHPWHYREHAARSGIDADLLAELLEWLWLEGLVQKAPAPAADGVGPGVLLTPLGEEVLRDPERFERLARGEAVVPTDPGAVVRQTLRQPIRPLVTRLLLAANLLVFGYCLYLAGGDQPMLQGYLAGRITEKTIERVLHPAGSVSAIDLLKGEWWRMLTACFVHGGLLHLGMNMYALYGAGRFVEQTWGRWRYLVIYLVAGWGGSCMALALAPTRDLQVVITVVGASGALCGVLATEAVWILLYSRHLPRALARRGRSQMVTTVVLMVVISLIPGVSGWGHLGGALAGGAAALALHLGRFAAAPWRWLAWPLVTLIPMASYAHLQHSRETSRPWQTLQRAAFLQTFGRPVARAMDGVLVLCEKQVNELIEVHPTRRDAAKVEAALTALEQAYGEVEALLDEVERSRLAPDGGTREQALAGLHATAALCEAAENYLRLGPKARRPDEQRLSDRFRTVDDLRAEWLKQGKER